MLIGGIAVIPEVDETLGEALRAHLGSRTQDVRLLLKEFHNVFIKNVTPAIPRKVYWSQELKRHPLYNAEKKRLIEEIAEKLQRGDSIQSHLSERSNQLNQYDLGLSHFGVHHLHLGEKTQGHGVRAGRVKGTKSLLFARFTNSEAYLLDILNHGIRSGFLNAHLFRVMHSNWPDSVEKFRLKGAVGVAVKYSDDELAKLLENDVNVIVEMAQEQVYMLPGMGTTTAGTSLLVELRVDRTIDELRAIVQLVKENSRAARALMKNLTGAGHNVIRLRGRIRAGLIDVYDART
jgi:hypothetical protein